MNSACLKETNKFEPKQILALPEVYKGLKNILRSVTFLEPRLEKHQWSEMEQEPLKGMVMRLSGSQLGLILAGQCELRRAIQRAGRICQGFSPSTSMYRHTLLKICSPKRPFLFIPQIQSTTQTPIFFCLMEEEQMILNGPKRQEQLARPISQCPSIKKSTSSATLI